MNHQYRRSAYHVPKAFNYVRSRIDAAPRRMGQWFLTGFREAALMMNITESMAGRAAVLQLLPLSAQESSRVSILRGGYPEALARPGTSSLWFSSYVQTYLERDVRSVSAVYDLAAFHRFLALIASRHGGILNKSDIAAPLGISVPGVGRWLDILEATAQILVTPPSIENVGKRLIKSPKVYIADSGLACHLLGIKSAAELGRSPFAEVLFEGFVASEIAKAQMNAGRRRAAARQPVHGPGASKSEIRLTFAGARSRCAGDVLERVFLRGVKVRRPPARYSIDLRIMRKRILCRSMTTGTRGSHHHRYCPHPPISLDHG
jgi:hypothetical protein